MKGSTEGAVIALALLTGWAVLTIARETLVPALALLLTVAGWRPAPMEAATEAPDPLPLPPALPAPPLGELTVAELRRVARAAGLKTLARTGRRAELLVALAPALALPPPSGPDPEGLLPSLEALACS